jgi:hypothetical protein
MDVSKTFYQLTYRTWFYLFFLFQLLLIALMIATLSVPKWVHSENNLLAFNPFADPGGNFFNGNSFKGSLSSSQDNTCCTGSYRTLEINWCEKYDSSLASLSFLDPIINIYKSICYMFIYLLIGMIFFIVGEVVAILCIVAWAVFMIFYMKGIDHLNWSFCFAVCAFVFHYVGSFVFIGITKTNFSNDCRNTPNDGRNPSLCADDGPALIIVNAVFIPILVVLYFFVGCAAKREFDIQSYGSKRTSYKETNAVEGVAMAQITSKNQN